MTAEQLGRALESLGRTSYLLWELFGDLEKKPPGPELRNDWVRIHIMTSLLIQGAQAVQEEIDKVFPPSF
jgi:hypothetical protein